MLLRFSGHDTFHCKEQWILKGIQLIVNEGNTDSLRTVEAISKLGVGKNMVRSIHHWLRAFGLVNENGKSTEFSDLMFIREKLDPFLENEGSLWLLQYNLCKGQYASIFYLIFTEYFSDKASLDFSESQIQKFISKAVKANDQKPVATKTLENDFNVFIRSYVAPLKNQQTVEDDFNVPLIPLNLISNTGRKNENGEAIYRINKIDHDIPEEIFLYCLLAEFEAEVSISFDDIRRTVGSYLCLSNDKLDDLLNQISNFDKGFVYKNDAGIRQIQMRKNKSEMKTKILEGYYGFYK